MKFQRAKAGREQIYRLYFSKQATETVSLLTWILANREEHNLNQEKVGYGISLQRSCRASPPLPSVSFLWGRCTRRTQC